MEKMYVFRGNHPYQYEDGFPHAILKTVGGEVHSNGEFIGIINDEEDEAIVFEERVYRNEGESEESFFNRIEEILKENR